MEQKMKVMCVLGTRPEVIKLASFLKELENSKHELTIVNTGQHRELVNDALSVFNISSNYDFKIMEKNQSLEKITKKVLGKLERVIAHELPDMMVVLGDTTTAFSAALCAFYNKIKLVHIEAGPRSYNKYNGFPEEMNRRMIDHLADINFCQNKIDLERLKKENVHNCYFVGNTSLDVVKTISSNVRVKNQVLITMHRRESWGIPMKNVCAAIRMLAINFSQTDFIISLHPNPKVSNLITKELSGIKNVFLKSAFSFIEFITIMAESKMIMTDSGGIVQEAMFLGKPLVYLREKSEYEHLFDGKFLAITGTDTEKIIKHSSKMLNMENPCYSKIEEFGNILKDMYREGTMNANSIGDFANGEAGINIGSFTNHNNAFKSL
jgi:UDP-N-acetylglucosamine 2-epimerase (non-hydrolysing)